MRLLSVRDSAAERDVVEASAGGANDKAIGVRGIELGGAKAREGKPVDDGRPGLAAIIGQMHTGRRADVVELRFGGDHRKVVRVLGVDGNAVAKEVVEDTFPAGACLLYTSPSPRDRG